MLDTCNLPRLKRIATIDLRFFFLYTWTFGVHNFPRLESAFYATLKHRLYTALLLKGGLGWKIRAQEVSWWSDFPTPVPYHCVAA